MHPAASPERNYMLDAPAAIRQQHQQRKWPASLDHLVGALLEQRRHVQAERFRSLEIDDKLVFGWRLDHAGQFDERNLCLFRPRQSGAGSAFRPIGAASARY